MFNLLGVKFIELLKDFAESGKQVTIVHSNLGPLSGRLIEVNNDLIHLKILDLEAKSFYNMFIPVCYIVATQTLDEGIKEDEEN